MDIIAPDETLIKKIHPSRCYFWEFYFIGILLIIVSFILPVFNPVMEVALENMQLPQISNWLNLALILFGLGAILIVELLRVIHLYYVTDKRVIQEFRFLSRRVTSCYHNQVQNMNAVQGILERILGIGNLEFHTAGLGQSNRAEINFRGVMEPMAIKNLVTEAKLKSEVK